MEKMRWRGAATRWNNTGYLMAKIYGGLVAVLAVCYPALMVYLGDIPGVEGWESRVKIGVTIGGSVGAIVMILDVLLVLGAGTTSGNVKRSLVSPKKPSRDGFY